MILKAVSHIALQSIWLASRVNFIFLLTKLPTTIIYERPKKQELNISLRLLIVYLNVLFCMGISTGQPHNYNDNKNKD